MPRNKTAKRLTKRAAAPTSLANAQKMEKDFIDVPAKLASQLTKEINSLKQKEAKLKAALNKAKAQTKASEGKIKKASKANKSATGKKQLAVAKKTHANKLKIENGLNNQLDETSNLLNTILSKQAKFIMIGKLLNQFEKEWSKGAKKSKTAKASVKKTTKKKKVTAKEQSPTEAMDTPANEVRHDEVTEITS